MKTPKRIAVKVDRFIRLLVVLCALYSGLGGLRAIAANPESAARLPIAAHPSAAQRLTRGSPVPQWVESAVVPAETTSQPMTIRLADTQIYVDQQPTTYVHTVTQANEASMLSAMGRIEITFQPDYQQVALHSVKILRGGTTIDKTQTVDIRFLQREQELESGIYNGSVTASIVLDDIRLGDSVDITYSISGQNPVFTGKFSQSSYWDSIYATQRRRVILNTPLSRQIYYRTIGQAIGQIDTKEQKVGDRKIVRFQGENLTAIDFESYVPNDLDQFRWIQFSEFKSWKEVSQWASNLFDVGADNTDLATAVAAIGHASSPEKTVQNALAYVQNQIRYLSISMGENSHKPFAPDLVLSRRYGDCKDKSLLLVRLLNRLGIEASPVLLSASTPKGLSRLLPSPKAFDHAIVSAVVNGKTYYLDPTRSGQFGPLENMGQTFIGGEVLVVKPGTTGLVPIPEPLPFAGYSDARTEKIVLKQIDGSADVSIVWKYQGLDSEMVRYYTGRQSQDTLKKYYSASLLKRHSAAEIKSGPTITDDKNTNTVSIEMQFRVPKFLEKLNNGWLIRYESSNLKERFYIPESPRRMYPLFVPNLGSKSLYSLEVLLPEDVDANYKPSETNIENAAFKAKELLSFKGRSVRVVLELEVAKDRVEPKDVDAFLIATRKYGELLNGTITVRSTDFKASASSPVADTPLKQRIQAKQEELVSQSTIALADASASGLNTFVALCERGLAHARLGRKSEALNDIASALKADPASVSTVLCRGEIALLNGDMKSSEIDFTRAISLGNADGRTYFLRGMANYSLMKWQEAERDFEMAKRKFANIDDRVRAEIMQAFAVRRSNPAVKSRAASVGAETWPEVVFSALEGSKNDEEVLRQVHKRIGDDLELALHDAYFYLGQLNLINANKLKASVYLQRALDKGVLTSPYRQAARMDVDRVRR